MSRYYLEKITEIYVFVRHDEDGEGVVAQRLGDTFMPFVCADKERVESLMNAAKHIVNATGEKIKLIKFTHREEIQEII
jgi:hypothetical protein